jgi:uncharacterized protein involved in oxidation of intracellular sulfur
MEMQSVLLIITSPAYGNENGYNALRLARALVEGPEVKASVFLMGDAVAAAKRGQETPNGYYNLAKMLLSLTQKGVGVGLCGTCMDARGIQESELVDGAHRGSMKELADLVQKNDKVLTF